MEIQKQEIAEKLATRKRSDWCKALSYYSKETQICRGCSLTKSQLKNFELPLEKAEKKLLGVNLAEFEDSMLQIGKPLIFTSSDLTPIDSFLLYYTHGIIIDELATSLSPKYEGVKPKATIVSPDFYSKSKRSSETQLVREVQKYFDPTAFIKLQIFELNDLITYAKSEKCQMLILPMNKLAEYLEYVGRSKTEESMAAAFYPIQA